MVREEDTPVAAAHLVLQLGVPSELAARLPSVGEVVIRPVLLSRTAARAWLDRGEPPCEKVTLGCAGQVGVLFVEQGLAVSLVNTVLGLGVPSLAGPLSRIERGVLAGTLATMLAEFGLSPGVRLDERGAGAAGVSVVALAITLRGWEGRAWLAASDLFHAALWLPSEPRRTYWLEVAATTVQAGDLAVAGPGDRIVFDETAALPLDGAWPVRIHLEKGRLSACWLADGTVVAADVPEREAVTRPGRPSALRRTGNAAFLATGTVSLAAGCDVAAVDPSRSLRIVIPRGGPLLVEVEGRRWGYGEITALDGALALTITRILAGYHTESRTARP